MTVILPHPDEHFTWVPAPWRRPPSPAAARRGPADPADDNADGHWVLECRPLAAVAPHFFTTRVLHLRADAPQAQADWARVAAGIGVPLERLERMRQVHGCTTFAVRPGRARGSDGAARLLAAPATPEVEPEPRSTETGPLETGPREVAPREGGPPEARPDVEPEADALVTDRPDVALVVRVADCVPLLMADPRTGAVAAVHAGWRGTAAGIAAAAVRRLQQEYGSDPADLIAAIGPSIGACCYQVGPDVREAFRQAGHAPATLDRCFSPELSSDRSPDLAGGGRDRWRLDTWAANRDQLIAAGLLPARVHVAGLCTRTHLAHFYSYRAEGPPTGRLLGVIRRST